MTGFVLLGISFILVLLVAYIPYKKFGWTPEEGVAFSAALIMILVFLAGMIDAVQIAVYIVIAIAGLGIVLSIVSNKKISYVKKDICGFFTPGVVMIAVMFIYAVVAYRRVIYSANDEIVQWGSAVEFMVKNNRLPYGEAYTADATILSAPTLFQYFMLFLSGYKEVYAIVAQTVLTFIGFALPLSGCTWKDWKRCAVYFLIMFLSLNLVSYLKYYNILCDFPVAAWSGGFITWIVLSERAELFKKAPFVAAMLLCIGMMKSMVGPLFAYMAAVVYAMAVIIKAEPQEKGGRLKKLLTNYRTYIVIAMFVLPMLMYYIWGLKAETNSMIRGHFSATSELTNDVYVQVLRKMSMPLNSGDAIPYSLLTNVLVSTIVIAIVGTSMEKSKMRTLYVSAGICYILGHFVLVVIMMYAYRNVFTYNDAVITAGIERYYSHYVLMGFPFLCGFALNKKTKLCYIKEKKIYADIAVILMLLICVLGVGSSFMDKATFTGRRSSTLYNVQTDIENTEDKLSALSEEGKVFVYGNTGSIEISLISQATDNRITKDDFYIRVGRATEDPTMIKDFLSYPYDILVGEGYDYVYIYDIENNSIDALKEVFNISDVGEGDIYKVIDSGDTVYLEHIGNIEG